MPHATAMMPTTDRPAPTRSSDCPRPGDRNSGSSGTLTAMIAIAHGRFSQKAARQPEFCTSRPPTTGPAAAPRPVTADQIAMARTRSRSSVKILRIIDTVEGISIAAPIAHSARPTSSCHGSFAVAATIDASANTTHPATNMRLRPIRSPSPPHSTSSPPSSSA
ncbi:hypothetical protein DFR70_109276 [Nocardia tenerifensis]|uniref:Uncharacterized protein n=1 Tax=Nocardia tenerifensis TaxID=228006 RepID=A0A318K1P6_9NOCA|nr:hypothetical protein [Nocardia tenerifensis]PXX61085.1 hypothetical protein DFR70_109276 [Nocardia tenerifensis]